MTRKQIPGFPNYTVDETGLILTLSDKVVKTWRDKGKLVTVMRGQTGYSKMTVGRVVALAFLDKVDNKDKVVFLDGDGNNPCLENVAWGSSSDVQTTSHDRRLEERLKDIGYPTHLSCWGVYPNQVESKRSGFFYIPFERTTYGISKEGVVIDLFTGETKPCRLNHKGYPTIKLSNRGRIYPVHRLVALMFVKVPDRHADKDVTELQVNHKNGVKKENHRSNLEWVTNLENMVHARESGLFSNGVQVETLNVVTGEETLFQSVSEMIRKLGLRVSPTTMLSHITGPLAGRVIREGYRFKEPGSGDWPTTLVTGPINTDKGWKQAVFGVNLLTDENRLFASLEAAAEYIGVTTAVLKNHRQRKGPDVSKHGWVFKTTNQMPYLPCP